MPKIIEIVSADYYASPNDHVVLADGMNIKDERINYIEWCSGRRVSFVHGAENNPWMTFSEWLISKGARKPSDDELETFME